MQMYLSPEMYVSDSLSDKSESDTENSDPESLSYESEADGDATVAVKTEICTLKVGCMGERTACITRYIAVERYPQTSFPVLIVMSRD